MTAIWAKSAFLGNADGQNPNFGRHASHFAMKWETHAEDVEALKQAFVQQYASPVCEGKH